MQTHHRLMLLLTLAAALAAFDHFGSGAFNTPVGAGGPAPIFPGEAYEVRFGAAPGQAPRQGGADTGAVDAQATVRAVNDGYLYPAVGAVVQVSVAVQ